MNKLEATRGWKTANWMMLSLVADMLVASKKDGKLKLKPRPGGEWMLKSQVRVAAVLIMQQHETLKECAGAFIVNDECTEITWNKKGLKALAKWWWSTKAEEGDLEPQMPLLYSAKDADGKRQVVWKDGKNRPQYETAR